MPCAHRLRAGELLGLKWKHVSLSKRANCVLNRVYGTSKSSRQKPESSRDSVWFDDILKKVLSEHRQRSPTPARTTSSFAKPDGSPLNPDVLRRDVLYPALDRLRIPRLKGASGFHAFRHTAGSVVEERTGRLKLAQRLLRHSNVSTTADIYTHTSRQSEREAALALERAYFGDLFPVVPNSETENKKAVVQ